MFNLLMQYNLRLYRGVYKHVINECTMREDKQIILAPTSTTKRDGKIVFK